MDMTVMVDRLRTYRLQHDLTFDALAEQMADAGCSVQSRNLHRLLNLQTKPRDRTLFKVESFIGHLDRLQQQQQRRRPRRRKVAR
jgi:hypothetical protein